MQRIKDLGLLAYFLVGVPVVAYLVYAYASDLQAPQKIGQWLVGGYVLWLLMSINAKLEKLIRQRDPS